MPRQTNAGEFVQIVTKGPSAQYVPQSELIAQVPGTINASSTWTSNVLNADGYYDLVLAVTINQTGNLKVQRYIDDNGTVVLDAGQTQALTAGVSGVLIVNDGKPFSTYKVSIQNTAVSAATVAAGSFAALTSAH